MSKLFSLLSSLTNSRQSESKTGEQEKGGTHLDIAVIGPSHSGKTILTSTISFVLKDKFSNRWYPIQDLDHLDEEKERGLSIGIGKAQFNTEKYSYTLYDCPGHDDNRWKSYSMLKHVDGAIIVIDVTDERLVEMLDEILPELKKANLQDIVFCFSKHDNLDEDDLFDITARILLTQLKENGFDINAPIWYGSALGALNSVLTHMKIVEKLIKICDHQFGKNAKEAVETVKADGISYLVDEKNHTAQVYGNEHVPDGTICIPGEITVEGKSYQVTSIGDFAFEGNEELTSISIPKGVRSIGDCAFDCCTYLESVNIPDGVVTIGDGAFANCQSLTSIDLPNSVTSIGRHAFEFCFAMQSVKLPDGITEIDDNVFCGCGDEDFLITIPPSVRRIGKEAFCDCDFPSINIPVCLEEIGESAFSGCNSVESIVLPKSLKRIGGHAFQNCTDLKYFIMENDDPDCLDISPLAFNTKKKSEQDEDDYATEIFENTILKVPSSAADKYRRHKLFGNFKKLETWND